MNPPKDTIHIIAPFFKPYLNIICLNGEQYYFRKETTSLRDENGNKRFFHPKIGHQMLRDYHSTQDEILYLAVPINADINDLKEGDFLYIGSAKKGGARFWRGKKDKMTRFEKNQNHAFTTNLCEGEEMAIQSKHIWINMDLYAFTP